MRIALFGGSFDPPHRGHVALARLALERLHLDRVLIAPVGLQPLKQDAASASFEERMAMAELAFAGDSRIELSRIDAVHPDGRPNYTIETILNLKQTLTVGDDLFCLMGADSWLTIGKWYRAPELLMACDFIVGARPGFDLGRAAKALPRSVSIQHERSDISGCNLFKLGHATGSHTRLYLLPDLAEDVSATELRAALGHNPDRQAKTVLAAGVANYIHEHKLYGVDI
jgi:nicotinate-nucleotide adenylyltransferase